MHNLNRKLYRRYIKAKISTCKYVRCVCPVRGKGEYFRLGNENISVQSTPRVVEGLVGKMVVQVAVGSFHVLALTDTGEVCHSFLVIVCGVFIQCEFV